MFLQNIATIFWKDVQIEFRNRELVSTMLVFGLLLVLIFNFALDLERVARASVVIGAIWITSIFSGTLALNRVFVAEQENGCLTGLLLAPIDRLAIYFGKLASTLLFMLITQAVLLPAFQLFYSVPLTNPVFLATIFLGTLGYAVIGTLVAALTLQTRTRELLLPVLLLPLCLPLLLAVVKTSLQLLENRSWQFIAPAFHFTIAYDVIFIALALLLFGAIVEES
jgi:heme exporter protein B